MPTKPSRNSSWPRTAGYTLIEIIVVVGIVGLVVAASAPSFNRTIRKIRTQALLEDLSTTLLKAQKEAFLRGVPVVVEPRPGSLEVFIFANVDRDAALSFSPDATAAPRTADYEIARFELPSLSKVYFDSPPTNNGNGNGGNGGNGNSGSSVVDGLTLLASRVNGIVFEPDGSVRDTGAFRLADNYGNFFEIRVQPAATGRIRVLKYRAEPPWGDDAGFFPTGTDPTGEGPMWAWSTSIQ